MAPNGPVTITAAGARKASDEHHDQATEASLPTPTTPPTTAPGRSSSLLFRISRMTLAFLLAHLLFTGELPGGPRIFTSAEAEHAVVSPPDGHAPSTPRVHPALPIAGRAAGLVAFWVGRSVLESVMYDAFAVLGVLDWPLHSGSPWNAYTAKCFLRFSRRI